MAVELKTEEEVIVTQTLAIREELTDDEKRPLGLACHSVVEDFPWDLEDSGHDKLQQLLKDIKHALGVRVSRKKDDSKPKTKRKKRKAKQPEDSGDNTASSAGEGSDASGNGDKAPTEGADASPPKETPDSVAESGGAEDQTDAADGSTEGTGEGIHDPFAVPPGSQTKEA